MFGSGVDDSVAKQRGYRHLNPDCARLDLSGRLLDAPTLRGLVKCLNSTGAIEPFSKLLDRLEDSDVEPILSTIHRYWLSDSKRVFQVERAYDDLNAKGMLDPMFRELGRLLANDEFWTELISLLERGYAASSHLPPAERDVLKLLERVGRKVSPESLASGLDAGISVAGSRAFRSLQARFRGPSPSGRSLRQVTDPLISYLKPTTDPGSVAAGRELLAAYVKGDLFTVLDQTLGSGEELRARVSRLSTLLALLSRENGRLLDGLTSLFHYLNRPVECMGGSKVLPNADMHVLRATSGKPIERAGDFLRRENVLMLMTLGPLCKYPPELGKFYPRLFEIADTNAIEPVARIVHAVYGIERVGPNGRKTRPMAELLVSILADTGSPFPGGPQEDSAGLKLLTPLASEVADRGAWDDLLLILSMVRPEDRLGFASALRWWLEPGEGMGGKGAHDVFMETVAALPPESIERFVRSLKAFVDSDEPLLAPALDKLRLALHVNDAHPFVELISGILRDATANERFFSALFRVSKLPEFRGTIRLLSDMGKDGRLTELAQLLVTLYHRFAFEGQSEIRLAKVPAFDPLRAHDLAKSDLVSFPLELVKPEAYLACGKLDFRFDLSQPTHPSFPAQLDAYLGCVNNRDDQAGVSQAIRFLHHERTEDGRSFLGFSFGLVRSLALAPAEQGYVAEAFVRASDDGRVDKLLKALPFLLSREVRGAEDPPGSRGAVLRPLFDAVGAVIEKVRDNLKRPQEWLASVLARQDAHAIIKHADWLWKRDPGPLASPLPSPFDRGRVERWVKNKSCALLQGPDGSRVLEGEIQRVFHEHLPERQAITYGTHPTTGGVWDAWEFRELKPFLEPLFKRFASPAESAPERPVLGSMLNLLRYFTLPRGAKPDRFRHFPPEELQRWLYEHSRDQRLISYYYPKDRENPDLGYEEHPRVRVVSTLERVEMIFNADLNPPVLPLNEGYEFLSYFAKAWGDEDPSVWPEEIRREFPDPSRPPPTLAKAVLKLRRRFDQMVALVGLPDKPPCLQVADANDPPEMQRAETSDPEHRGIAGRLIPNRAALQRRLFNLRHLLDAVDGMFPRPRPDGSEYAGLKVFRDLFFELFYSSPHDARNSTEDCDKRYTRGQRRGEWKENYCRNNLWVIMKVARAGLLHQIARELRSIPSDDSSLKDVIRVFTESTGESYGELLRTLEVLMRRDSERRLLWGLIEQIFKTLETDNPADHDAIKQLGYYGLANLSAGRLTVPGLRLLAPALERHYDLLAANSAAIGKFTGSASAAKLLRTLYEDPMSAERARIYSVAVDALSRPELAFDVLDIAAAIDSTPSAARNWSLFRSRLDVVREIPEYRAIDLSDFGDDLVAFFAEDSTDPVARTTARRIRDYMAERLRARDLEQLGVLASRRPKEFYQVLNSLGDAADRGDLQYFLQAIQMKLEETAR